VSPLLDTPKPCPDERSALRNRIQSIEAELTALDSTRGNRKEWAKKWDQLLTEFFALKDRIEHE
jgi:hypothetical protein